MTDRALPPDVTGTVATVGTFDGFHRGHRDLVERLVARARARTLRSVLVTFDPHPLMVVRPESAPPLLTVGDERLELLADTGLDYLAVVPFTPALAALDAEAFVSEVLETRFAMRELVVGYDHGFGRGRSADAHTLQEIGSRRGFAVTVVAPVTLADGRAVSSTIVRTALLQGELDAASEALGRPYSFSGRVQPGEARGRELGFRTVNLALASPQKLLPPDGVYAVRVDTPDGRFGGMLNLGARPTFGSTDRTVEAHLFDANGGWYGRWLRIEVLARLRDVRRFPDAAALVAQLRDDEQAARAVLARTKVGTSPLMISVDPAHGRT